MQSALTTVSSQFFARTDLSARSIHEDHLFA
jgi:hypothetical protein